MNKRQSEVWGVLGTFDSVGGVEVCPGGVGVGGQGRVSLGAGR